MYTIITHKESVTPSQQATSRPNRTLSATQQDYITLQHQLSTARRIIIKRNTTIQRLAIVTLILAVLFVFMALYSVSVAAHAEEESKAIYRTMQEHVINGPSLDDVRAAGM